MIRLTPAAAESEFEKVRLCDAELGSKVCVSLDEGDVALRRLQQLGLCERQRFSLISRGNPLIIQVDRTEIGISAQVASHILVASCEDEADDSEQQELENPCVGNHVADSELAESCC